MVQYDMMNFVQTFYTVCVFNQHVDAYTLLRNMEQSAEEVVNGPPGFWHETCGYRCVYEEAIGGEGPVVRYLICPSIFGFAGTFEHEDSEESDGLGQFGDCLSSLEHSLGKDTAITATMNYPFPWMEK